MSMGGTQNQLKLERNIRFYPWYAVGFNAFAWMPMFFLYFSEHLPLEDVLCLEAIYYAAVVLLEVPSGYFSDAVGRRLTLIISSASLATAYVLFVLEQSFATFALAQVFLAVGISFNSGTDTSFHYDSLASLGRESEFAAREATVVRFGLLSSGVAALVGGCAALADLYLAYVVSTVAALLTLLLVLNLFVEPKTHQQATGLGHGFFRQVGLCMGYLRNRSLAWLFGFAVLMTVLNHVPYEFYQPYIELSLKKHSLLPRTTPLVAGIHMALAMVLGSYAAGLSIRLQQRCGTTITLLLTAVIQTMVIGMMGLVMHAWIIPLILLRVVPRALMTAPLNAAVAPQVQQAHRATYLSIQSLIGRLSYAGVLLALSLLVAGGVTGDPDELAWPSLSRMLQVCLALAGLGLLLLGVIARWCGPPVKRSLSP